MTDNKRMRESGYGRGISREESRGGYDPGFLTGGDGYRRTGRDRAGYDGDTLANRLGRYDREISRGKYRGGYDPGFLG